MSLHVFRIDMPARSRTEPVELSFELLQAIQPALVLFREQTGMRISEYDDVKLEMQQVELLLKLISAHYPKPPPRDAAKLMEIKRLLSQASDRESYFIAQGE